MIGKFVFIVAILSVLSFSLGFLYQNLPQKPIEMVTNTAETASAPGIEYGATPVFAENLRFNHNNISYFIGASCSETRASAMRKAFQILENKTKVVRFEEKYDDEADVIVRCSNKFVNLGGGLFTAGEGGPREIINTSYFNIIERGEVLLYKDSSCSRPVVELHELLHVFGFNHSSNPRSIMYNVSNCGQKITPDIIRLIEELYSIAPLPDAKISKLSAVKRGKYLDFNITITNDGLTDIENINLTLSAEGKKLDEIPLGKIGVGYVRTLRVTNLKLPSRSLKEIIFEVDHESLVKELDENNNLIKMTVPAS